MRIDDELLQTQGFVEEPKTGLLFVNPEIDSPKLEFALSQMGSPTSTYWREAISIIGITEHDDIKGRNFLDIGGACSSLTAWLLSKGANAFSIDPGYEDVAEMVKKAQISALTDANPTQSTQAIDEFLVSIRSQPDHYITGWATRVPKPSGYFDYITAIRSVFFYMDVNPALLSRVINEQIRLLKKPGGLFVGFPLTTDGPLEGFGQVRRDNAVALVSTLKTRTDLHHQHRMFHSNGRPLPGLTLDIHTR